MSTKKYKQIVVTTNIQGVHGQSEAAGEVHRAPETDDHKNWHRGSGLKIMQVMTVVRMVVEKKDMASDDKQ